MQSMFPGLISVSWEKQPFTGLKYPSSLFFHFYDYDKYLNYSPTFFLQIIICYVMILLW